jgi:hypothetical protein
VEPSGLRGNYFVAPTASAFKQAMKLCDGRMREFQKLRRHGLKLMWWPAKEGDEAGHDCDWDWIKTLESKRIGELRIDERINNHRNVRIIFFKANLTRPDEPLPRIWLMETFAKDHQKFSSKELKAFAAMRDWIVFREYGGSSLA